MIRHVLALPLFLAMILVLAARADDTEKSPQKNPERDEAAMRQIRLNDQFSDFKASLLNLARRLESSSRPEDRERAVVLKHAIATASEKAIDLQFLSLINLLKENKALSLNELKDAMDQTKLLADDIHALLAILLSDDRDAQNKKERERLEALIKYLDKIIRDEKVERANTESGRLDKNTLLKAQQKVTKATEALAKAMSKNSQGDGKGKGKNGKGGQGKGTPKEGEPKEGPPKEGKPSSKNDKLPDPQETNGRKEVQEATGDQKNAEKNMKKEKNKDASDNLDEAIKKLETARKQLEELLRQLREEELRRLLAKLEGRCQRMLAMQIEVYNGTVAVERAINQNEDRKASRNEEQRALKLSDKERDIVREAETCLKLLESEGSAVAFTEIFIEVRDDMLNVTRRLGKADVGSVTQLTEQDIIAILKEMIEALKKAQSAGGGKGGGSPNRGNQSLIDLLAELKIIRSMQIRVNSRTLTYAQQYPGEQANDPDIHKELENLAQRQQKIFEVTNNIARGKTENRPGQ